MPDKKQIKSIYRRLTIMRDKYSDTIPQEEIMSGSPNNRYKCRMAWWGGIRNELDNLEQAGVLSDPLKQRYHDLWTKYRSSVEEDRFGVKPEHIREANDLVTLVLNLIKPLT